MANLISRNVCAISISPAIDRTAYINDFTLDRVNRVESFLDAPGSKGINIALNLAAAGLKSTCSGFLGGSRKGFIEKSLSDSGVICDFIPVSYDVRINTKIVDLKNGTHTDINFKGGNPTDNEVSLLKERVKSLAKANDFIAMSGVISSPNLQNLYSELILEINSKKTKICVDCCGESLRLAASAKPFAIKPNLSEFNETFSLDCKTDQDVKNAAMKLCENGPENILVSLDKDGAVAVSKNRAYKIHNCKVDVLNTVGAGDAFLSGFIFASSQNFEYIDCLKYAASFAHLVISTPPGEKRSLEDFSKFVPHIKVEEI